MNAALRKWVPALAPALLVLLLGLQVLLGARGFNDPHSGPLGALELPGRLLGWGGVALLLPLLVWLLLGWWGFDVTGMALKTLGALTLGLSVGGLAALWGGTAQGGLIGGPLGGLLDDALGGFLATVLLLLMLVPGALLASARFQLGARATGAGADGPKPRNSPSLRAPPQPLGSSVQPLKVAAQALKEAGPIPKAPRAQGWYPEKRYDAQGNELPMTFGGSSDVGAIRFRDAEGEAAATEKGAPAEEDAARSASERGPGGWPQGLVADPEEGPHAAAAAGTGHSSGADDPPEATPPQDDADLGPLHVRDDRRETPPSRRARPAPPPATGPPAPQQRAPAPPPPVARTAAPPPPAPVPPVPPAPPAKVFSRQLFPKNPGDAVLLPGVRYRDEAEPPPPAPELPPAPAPAPQAPAPSAVADEPATRRPRSRKPAATPPAKSQAAPPPADELSPLGPPSVPYVRAAPPPTEEATVSRALEPLGDMAAMARYRNKLEASGIFASGGAAAPPTPPPRTPAAPTQAQVQAAAQAKVAQAKVTQAKLQQAKHEQAKVKRASEERLTPPAATQAPEPEKPTASGKPEKPKAGRSPQAETGKLFETESPPPSAPPAAKKAPPPEKKAGAKPPRGAWVEALKDTGFLQAVEAVVERGAASPVLLTRRLGVGYARAQALVERLALTGVVGEVAPNGSRPVLIRAEDLEAARPKPA